MAFHPTDLNTDYLLPPPAPEAESGRKPGDPGAASRRSGLRADDRINTGDEESPALLIVAALLVAAAAALSLTRDGAARRDLLVLSEALVVFLGLFLLAVAIVRLYRRTAALQWRMALVDAIAAAGDARFGPEPVVRRMLQVLRDHYAAEICVFVLVQPRRAPRLFRIEAGAEAAVELPPAQRAQLLPPLLAVPSGRGLVYHAVDSGVWRRETDSCRLYDRAAACPGAGAERERAEAVAAALDCRFFVSLPLSRQIRVGGRLFVASRQRRFGARDVALLHPVIEQLTLMLENTCLLEMLAAEAAEHERQRIARDLHDSAIQPYIGLKFGLEALARKLRQHPALVQDIQRLVERTRGEIADMRQLIDGLSETSGSEHDSLPAALRRQAARYSELFGVAVEVGCEGEQRLSRGLAREILHMVSEGLSNICRHTRAGKARIDLRPRRGSLELRIANDLGAGSAAPPPFVPRSLSERAAALGGSVAVEPGGGDRGTVITIRIPLEE